MAASFFFYDLETSGFSPQSARIMQFAGQRTDMELKPIGEPVNMLIKLTPDVLPDPEAVLLTGITPQATLQDGVTEAEFLEYFYKEVVKPDTVFLGYNSVRFDDRFMHHLNYRNFYDAYEWQWCDSCSKWDMLDVVRMTRALRPEGIEWPFTPDGKPSNRLELLTAANDLLHDQAHDALSDVNATIAVARMIRDKQPGLFDRLMDCHTTKGAKGFVTAGEPFVYTSGRYPSENLHTTMAVLLCASPDGRDGLVYDLRTDPQSILGMSDDELLDAWQDAWDPTKPRLPIKTLKYNHCPAVVPAGAVKDPAVQERLHLDMAEINKHYSALKHCKAELAERICKVIKRADSEREASRAERNKLDDSGVDGKLYGGGFFDDHDKQLLARVRAAGQSGRLGDDYDFHDSRLGELLTLYKARNFPQSLSDEERASWHDYCVRRLMDGAADSRINKYAAKLEELAASYGDDENKRFLLEELQLYAQSLVPLELTA